jgi:hypothetical protein
MSIRLIGELARNARPSLPRASECGSGRCDVHYTGRALVSRPSWAG